MTFNSFMDLYPPRGSIGWTAAVFAILLASGCGREPSTAPLSPGSPTDLTHSVSGILFGATAGSIQPFAGALVQNSYVDSRGSIATASQSTDANGRFVFDDVPHGAAVRLRADGVGGEVLGPRYQVCASATVITADTALDIELVPHGELATRRASPFLSGTVYADRPGSRTPAAGADVYYIAGCRGLVTAYTRTDQDGRYEFCAVPPGLGCLGAWVSWEGYGEARVAVAGDTVGDVEVKITPGVTWGAAPAPGGPAMSRP